MYALYSKKADGGTSRYQFSEEISIFGCNSGWIPRFVRSDLPTGQDEPYEWHVSINEALIKAGRSDTAIVIDIKPNQKDALLVELVDVWGHSQCGWTPALFHLRAILETDEAATVDKNSFSTTQVPDSIYSVLSFAGTVKDGKLSGKWNPPSPSSTNSVLLWPETLNYFMACIRAA